MPTFARHDFLDVIVFSDPAGPKRERSGSAHLKRVKARMAIVAVGLTPLGHVVVLDAWADRATTVDFIAHLYDFWSRWHPSRIGIEEAAQQGLFIDSFDHIMRVTKGQRLPIQGVPVPHGQEKDYRIRTTLQPLLSEGRLILHANQLDLLSELRSFPRGDLRDLLDALAYAVQMLPPFRGQKKAPDSDLEHYVAYLQASGAPFDAIRAAQVHSSPQSTPSPFLEVSR